MDNAALPSLLMVAPSATKEEIMDINVTCNNNNDDINNTATTNSDDDNSNDNQ